MGKPGVFRDDSQLRTAQPAMRIRRRHSEDDGGEVKEVMILKKLKPSVREALMRSGIEPEGLTSSSSGEATTLGNFLGLAAASGANPREAATWDILSEHTQAVHAGEGPDGLCNWMGLLSSLEARQTRVMESGTTAMVTIRPPHSPGD